MMHIQRPGGQQSSDCGMIHSQRPGGQQSSDCGMMHTQRPGGQQLLWHDTYIDFPSPITVLVWGVCSCRKMKTSPVIVYVGNLF